MRVRRAAVNVIMVCLALIVLISGYKIYTIMSDYRASQKVYDVITVQAQDGGFTGDIDFEALRRINPDIIGWLYCEDTPVDYPVVQGADNDKYLKTLFDGSYGVYGTLFADCITADPFRQFNTIVYGHHMKDGSMLATLSKMTDPAWCDEHPRFELITPEGKYHLEIWAFLNQPSDSSIYTTNISDPVRQAAYIDMAESFAAYTTGISVTADDRLVILSTCSFEYEEARYIAVCKMVPWD